LPDENVTYASAMSRQSGQQPKLSLPGDEMEGGGCSLPVHSLTEATSNVGRADAVDWPKLMSGAVALNKAATKVAPSRCFTTDSPPEDLTAANEYSFRAFLAVNGIHRISFQSGTKDGVLPARAWV
jgi:hypothetical protein